MECQLKDISIHYESMGEGRPIIMLHGWTLDHRHMKRAMEPLFEERQGWKRIYPDLPGMGRTKGAEWITNDDQMLEVVLEFIGEVVPGERFVIAGGSYGGYIARGVALRRATLMDGLLLCVPVVRADTGQRTVPPHVVLKEDPALISEMDPAYADGFKEIAVVQSRKAYEALQKDFDPAVAVADQEFLARVREKYAFSFNVDALSEPFTRPVLFLLGRQDATCGYRDAWEILENYPRATFAVLDRAGHNLEIEQEGLFSALVAEWLDRVEESSA